MRIEIKYQMTLPDVEHTNKELEDYIKYMVGVINIMPKESPFAKDHDKTMSQNTHYQYEEIKPNGD